MNPKESFLEELRSRLSILPSEDREQWVEYYGEILEDRMEEGADEASAVAALGSLDEIVARIAAEIPLKRLVREKVKVRRSWQTWEIVFLIVGFPLWFPVLLAVAVSVFAVVFSLYVTLWSLVVSLWVVELSLGVSAIGGFLVTLMYGVQGNMGAALFVFGASLLLAGLTVVLFLVCKKTPIWMARLTKKQFLGMKYCLIGRGKKK